MSGGSPEGPIFLLFRVACGGPSWEWSPAGAGRPGGLEVRGRLGLGGAVQGCSLPGHSQAGPPRQEDSEKGAGGPPWEAPPSLGRRACPAGPPSKLWSPCIPPETGSPGLRKTPATITPAGTCTLLGEIHCALTHSEAASAFYKVPFETPKPRHTWRAHLAGGSWGLQMQLQGSQAPLTVGPACRSSWGHTGFLAGGRTAGRHPRGGDVTEPLITHGVQKLGEVQNCARATELPEGRGGISY